LKKTFSKNYSKTFGDKSIMRYRVADAKVKTNAKNLLPNMFHQPIDDNKIIFDKTIDFIYYFGLSSIYQINPVEKTCTSRYNNNYIQYLIIQKVF
jgi:hypothetical protein